MVINKFGDRLYTGLQDKIRAHLQGVAQRIDEAQGEGFLRELKLRWGNHNKSMQMIRDILMVCPCISGFYGALAFASLALQNQPARASGCRFAGSVWCLKARLVSQSCRIASLCCKYAA